jgi:hypothetical protein
LSGATSDICRQGFELRLTGGPTAGLEVGDPGRGPKGFHPRPRPDGSGGWGLVLVDRIADRWGVTRTPAGTSVWFEIEANR